MKSNEQLSIPTEALARICARYKVKELSMFGSAARGDLRPDSDIDLLVVFEEGARVGLVTLARVQSELNLFSRGYSNCQACHIDVYGGVEFRLRAVSTSPT